MIESLRVFIESLRQNSEMFGKCSGTVVWPSEQFLKIFFAKWSEFGNFRKIVKNVIISLAKRFHVAVRLFSNRSQMTSNVVNTKRWHTRP